MSKMPNLEQLIGLLHWVLQTLSENASGLQGHPGLKREASRLFTEWSSQIVIVDEDDRASCNDSANDVTSVVIISDCTIEDFNADDDDILFNLVDTGVVTNCSDAMCCEFCQLVRETLEFLASYRDSEEVDSLLSAFQKADIAASQDPDQFLRLWQGVDHLLWAVAEVVLINGFYPIYFRGCCASDESDHQLYHELRDKIDVVRKEVEIGDRQRDSLWLQMKAIVKMAQDFLDRECINWNSDSLNRLRGAFDNDQFVCPEARELSEQLGSDLRFYARFCQLPESD